MFYKTMVFVGVMVVWILLIAEGGVSQPINEDNGGVPDSSWHCQHICKACSGEPEFDMETQTCHCVMRSQDLNDGECLRAMHENADVLDIPLKVIETTEGSNRVCRSAVDDEASTSPVTNEIVAGVEAIEPEQTTTVAAGRRARPASRGRLGAVQSKHDNLKNILAEAQQHFSDFVSRQQGGHTLAATHSDIKELHGKLLQLASRLKHVSSDQVVKMRPRANGSRVATPSDERQTLQERLTHMGDKMKHRNSMNAIVEPSGKENETVGTAVEDDGVGNSRRTDARKNRFPNRRQHGNNHRHVLRTQHESTDAKMVTTTDVAETNAIETSTPTVVTTAVTDIVGAEQMTTISTSSDTTVDTVMQTTVVMPLKSSTEVLDEHVSNDLDDNVVTIQQINADDGATVISDPIVTADSD